MAVRYSILGYRPDRHGRDPIGILMPRGRPGKTKGGAQIAVGEPHCH